MPDAKASSDDQAPEILPISGTGCIGSDIFEINVSTNIDNIRIREIKTLVIQIMAVIKVVTERVETRSGNKR